MVDPADDGGTPVEPREFGVFAGDGQFEFGDGGPQAGLVVRGSGPRASGTGYDVDAITQDYREAMNGRLSDTGMRLDENSDVVADGFIDDNPRELLDDAMVNVRLPSIIERTGAERESSPMLTRSCECPCLLRAMIVGRFGRNWPGSVGK